ncbi:MAG: transcriptional regulator, partial [Candidatus Saliniplasma sp.]
MSFEIKISSHTPAAGNDLNEILEDFLLDIGYLSGRKTGKEAHESVPFRLWKDVFLKEPDKPRTVDEMAAMLETSKPTIYR